MPQRNQSGKGRKQQTSVSGDWGIQHQSAIQPSLFGGTPSDGEDFSGFIRHLWHEGEWRFAIVDVIRVLTDSRDASSYWTQMKRRLTLDEGFQAVLGEILPLPMPDAKARLQKTETATRETLLRLIQSIPSPKAEMFKRWLAGVGEERLQEEAEPEKVLQRWIRYYKNLGRPDEWIRERLRGDLIRNELTSIWQARGAQPSQYRQLTATLHAHVFEISVQSHRVYKELPEGVELRDHMSMLELAWTGVGEAAATMLHQRNKDKGATHLMPEVIEAGDATAVGRRAFEQQLGMPVVTPDNFLAEEQEAKKRKRVRDRERKAIPDITATQPGIPTPEEVIEEGNKQRSQRKSTKRSSENEASHE